MAEAYGGQAVIEGVMLTSREKMVVSTRLDSGEIKDVKKEFKFYFLQKIFFIRGMINLVLMFKRGVFALNWSADQHMNEDEDESSVLNSILIFATTIFSLALAILIFKFTPLALTKLIGITNGFLFNFVEGMIKLSFLVGYIFFLGLFKETKRIFEYHGAEHKVVACQEAKEEYTVKNCKKFKKEHKRCGTNFIFFVISVSIVVYLFIPISTNIWMSTLFRLMLLPVIAGISYEVLKIAGKFDNWFTTMIAMPGIFLQKLTTKEPTDDQIEVALHSLEKLLR